MPDLPRVAIENQALYDRAVAAFPGDTSAQKVKAFRIWTRRNLLAFVIERETQALIAAKKEQAAEIAAALNELQYDSVDNPPPPPQEL